MSSPRDKFKKAREEKKKRNVFSKGFWSSSSPGPAHPKPNSSPIRNRSNKYLAVDSSSVAAHSSTRSVDVHPPRTAASTSSGAANSVKLISNADDDDHIQSSTQLPMPNAISSMTISNFLPTRDSSIGALEQAHQNGDNLMSGGPLKTTDHNDLSLRPSGNQTQKSYNMTQSSSTSAMASSPPANGAYSNSDRLPLPNNRGGPAPISTVRALSGQFGGARSHSNLRDQNNMNSDGASSSTEKEWSSAVGGATTSGKSGRMIEKLMNERDAMRRQMHVLEEEKMEMIRERAMHAEMNEQKQARFEQELHEASTNSMLLKKRDRQVTDLKEKVDIERARAESFQESERVWKRELEKIQQEATQKITQYQHELRQTEASLKIYHDTWGEKRAAIDKIRAKLNQDVKQHLKTVVAHADAMAQRDQIYSQSSEQFKHLIGVQKKQKTVYENFKTKINEDLSDIKEKAIEREKESEEMKSKIKETCDKMGWVMNVKRNVRDAQ